MNKTLMIASVIGLSLTSFANTTPTLTLYSQPSSSSSPMLNISAPRQLNAVEAQWLQVQDTQTGKIGWISRGSLQKALGQPVTLTQILSTQSPNQQQYTRVAVSSNMTSTDQSKLQHLFSTMERQRAQMMNDMIQTFQISDTLAEQTKSLSISTDINGQHSNAQIQIGTPDPAKPTTTSPTKATETPKTAVPATAEPMPTTATKTPSTTTTPATATTMPAKTHSATITITANPPISNKDMHPAPASKASTPAPTTWWDTLKGLFK